MSSTNRLYVSHRVLFAVSLCRWVTELSGEGDGAGSLVRRGAGDSARFLLAMLGPRELTAAAGNVNEVLPPVEILQH